MKNMVKKNQVMITALALMIAVAGYLNFAGNRITQEEIVTTGSDTVETAKVTGDDSQYEDIQSMDSELVLEEDNYLEQSMDDILAEDITVDEENADLETAWKRSRGMCQAKRFLPVWQVWTVFREPNC